MRLHINHQTVYRYDEPVYQSVQYVRMMPPTMGNQRVQSWQLSAPGQKLTQQDGFGNWWTTLSMSQPHEDLIIISQGFIDLEETVLSIEDNRVAPELYLLATDYTTASDSMIAFASQYIREGHLSPLSQLHEFAEALVEKMPYTPGKTGVSTTAMEAFELGHGVCQDHTHVFLACLRHFGIPCRYVSGYLHIPNESHLASHAWAEVWSAGSWYCFDISNQLFTPSQHVQIAVGRDYLDAAPVRGMRKGGGNESMTALVQVLPI